MKYTANLFIAIVCLTLSASGQVNQNFENISSLSTLTNNCWQFLGTSLHTASASKSLSVSAASVGGNAWVITPFTDLTTSSTLSFTYQLSNKLTASGSRVVTVRTLEVDGNVVTIGTFTLNSQSAVTQHTFAGKSPVTGVRKIVIDVIGSGDETTVLYIDNISIGGTFNYNPPYWCKDKSSGITTIHHLKTFQGLLSGDRVHLQWVVAENENNQYFEVERSLDGKDYKTVATLQATGRVATEAYSHIEQLQGSAYYRLKLVSKGGIRMYSNVLFFRNGTAASAGISLLQNPVQQTLRLGFTADKKTTAIVSVYDMSGFRVFQKEYQTGKGYNVIAAELNAHLKKGLYFLEVAQDQNKITSKFIKE